MKQTVLLFAICLSLQAFSIELPKNIIGRYNAEVPAFEFKQGGKTIKASSYPVSIYMKSNSLRYDCGSISLFGIYTNLLEGDQLLQLTVNITNEKSVDFDLNLKIDKKKKTILVKGMNGVPQIGLQQDELTFYKEEILLLDEQKG